MGRGRGAKLKKMKNCLARKALVGGVNSPEHQHQKIPSQHQHQEEHQILKAGAIPEDGGGDGIVGPGVEEDDEVVGGPGVLIQVQFHLLPLQHCVH